jgi:excisionase family DNA binding protein
MQHTNVGQEQIDPGGAATPRGPAETRRGGPDEGRLDTPTTEFARSIRASLSSGSLTRDEVMTAREVAYLLRMPTSTVYELARRGVLPASRLGRAWRFLRPRLEEMLAA